MHEIFDQLDPVLAEARPTKLLGNSVRLCLRDVNRDIAAVNVVYRVYFGSHAPNRRAYGVDLQVGLLVEAALIAEITPEAKV
jgi:enamine deaminase RidA (YjgF/YER057c/UK114 family)